MKRKSVIIVAILIIVIGFAAISTTLIINGNARISENPDDFSVIFTSASLDGQDVYANVISQDKKTITFETKELKTLNDSSILNYEVTNNSSNYDAEVQVNCKVKEKTTAKYTSIKNELENNATIVKAKESVNGTLTITLNKTATEEVREEYVCTLEFNAVERSELGKSYSGPTEWTFDYTGAEQSFETPVKGTYKIETWGAQGGSGSGNRSIGGYGGYSTGNLDLNENSLLYINVGGQSISSKIGYNGGGSGQKTAGSISNPGGGGGGATHMSLISGLLSTLENSKDSILIVSGGGGGAGENSGRSGGSGGGLVGSKGTGSCYTPTGGTQITAGTRGDSDASQASFGKGGSAPGGNSIAGTYGAGGGGGGFYGGGAASFKSGDGCASSGAGGSGYIGNQLLTDKSMYCYNCQESTEESTKTISTTCVSETPTENCAKSGNGYARITLIK